MADARLPLNSWLNPRSYIIGMDGLQTLAMHRAAKAKADAEYARYVEELTRRLGPGA